MKSKNKRYLNADEAARLLDISVETLYAYVSRGKIRSELENKEKRTRRYYTEDIEKLMAQKAIRKNPNLAGSEALDHGVPMLESALTLITDSDVFYRGQSVTELAKTTSFETICGILWLKDAEAAAPLFAGNPLKFTLRKTDLAPIHPILNFQSLLPLWQSTDLGRHRRDPLAIAQRGATLLKLFAQIITQTPKWNHSNIAHQLTNFWGLTSPQHEALINTILVLMADHELNSACFTARCAAATGASIYSSINAGLCAFQGPHHGGASKQVEALFNDIEKQDPTTYLMERLDRGENIPGFGQSVYRGLDPRAACLLQQLEKLKGKKRQFQQAQMIRENVETMTGLSANIDFVLVLARRMLNLPEGSALTLFGLARVAGYTAHALEQYTDGKKIRPRSQYTGEQPV